MTVSFRKITTRMRFMNPRKDFALDEIPLEIRFDPLTGQTGRVFDLPYTPPDPPDMAELVRRSKDPFCPFCPEALEKFTPLFPKDIIPEGRVRVGKASLFPNLLPLDKYIGVAVLSDQHHIAMQDFTPDAMRDAFLAARAFIQQVAEKDPRVSFFYINWNYMPPAGSSMVHPHIQINCGEVPTNQHRLQMEACEKYHGETGNSFWHDYVEAEKKADERWIAEMGPTFWTMSFVSQSHLPDVWCLFPDHRSVLELGDEDLEYFLKGLSRVLRYLSRQNLYSFNMAMFSVKNGEHFRMNARVCPRHPLRAIGNSDNTYFQMLHKEPGTGRPPESVRDKVRAVFGEEE